MEQISSQVQPLNIGRLDFHKSHPDTYTLLKLEAAQLEKVNPWKSFDNFKEIGPKFLRKGLATQKNLIIDTDSSANNTSEQDPTHQLFCSRKFFITSDVKRIYYYTISLYQKTESKINQFNQLSQ